MPERIDLAPGSEGRRAELVVAALALAALTLLLFLPALSPDAAFYFRDVSQNHRPYRQLTLAMIEGGHAPLWNPLRGAGQPLMANPNALVLHPTTLLFFVLPLDAALKASVISMIYLAGLGTWLVLRDAGASRSASLVGAMLFAASGYMASLGNLINLLGSAAFMPLTLWLMGRAAARGFAPWGSLAALSLAVQVMAGEPAILLCTATAAAPLLLRSPSGAQRAPAAKAARVAGVVGLAATLSMIGLLPGVELLARSERGAGFDRAESLKWSLPPAALVETAAPGLFGDPTRAGLSRYWGGGVFDSGLPFILSVHLGAGALILAGLGLGVGVSGAGSTRTEAILMGAIALLGACLAMGRHLPFYPALLAVLPLSSVRYPVKFFLLATWAVAWLAARGFDAAGASPSAGPRLRCLAAPAALVAVATLMQFPAVRDPVIGGLGLPAEQSAPHLGAIGSGIGRAFLWMGALAALTGVALVMPALRTRRLLLAAVCVGGSLLAAGRLNPVVPSSFYDEEPALAGKLARNGREGRAWATPRPRGFAFRTPDAPDADSLRWGFRWDRMTLRNATYFAGGPAFAYDRGNERLDVLPGASVGRWLYEGTAGDMTSDQVVRLLTVAAVDRVVSYGGVDLPSFEEEDRLEGWSSVPVVVSAHSRPLPRAWLAGEVEIHPDPLRALARLKEPDFDPYRVVLLDEGRSPAAAVPAAAGGAPVARILADEPSRVLIETSSPAGAYLVLADTYYPGWVARVDGVEAPIARANVMFRAVAVPAGRHQVEFDYRPASVRAGLAVSLAALLLAALLARPRRA